MGPLRHAALAAGSAVAFLIATRDFTASMLVLASGTLIDADHIVDYVASEGFRLDSGALRSGAYFRKRGRALVLLHSYEIIAVAVGLVWSQRGPVKALGLLAGALPHLAADILTYRFDPACYSLAYRAAHGFRLSAFRPQAPGGPCEETHP